MITLPGYRIDAAIYESSQSIVYRGRRDADDLSVILKMLKNPYPTPEEVARFRREYEITRTLQQLSGTIGVHGLEEHQHHLVLVVEDFGATSLDRRIPDGGMALDDFFTLALAIVDGLAQIHQHQVIHKDINPSNVVYNPDTGQVKIIDFGISTQLSREVPAPRPPTQLEGTLPYLSPEQTGRMNRAVDYRADYYALGVSFYELLTGTVPFATTDPVELIHAHIATDPVPPHERTVTVPRAVSRIVTKLMAKTPEERYQSSYGLKRDLETCRSHRPQSDEAVSFEPGRYDVPERFTLPQRLYGREREIDSLLSAFDRVRAGAAELALVTGYAGIGKTSVVHEVHTVLLHERGYVATGKFDQLRRGTPYSALVQAFRDLMRQLLTEDEPTLAHWRDTLSHALGANGQVLIEVVPELEHIIGPQPPVPALPPTATRHRFNWLFQRLIRACAQADHPLVLFLDDLHWADRASLRLLHTVMTAPGTGHLFVIGAYRDADVGDTDPLAVTLEDIEDAGAKVTYVSLEPLDAEHLTRFVGDAFDCTRERAQPLAELLLAKTGGNPFFAKEFLRALYSDDLLTFDRQHGRWQWDVAQIRARTVTENLVDVMVSKIAAVPAETQTVLSLAACIGNRFDLRTLAHLHETSPRETADDLWAALTEGLIVPLGDAYKFVSLDVPGVVEEMRAEYVFAHDRVQEAAYALRAEEDRQAVHRRLGYLLLENSSSEEREERLFDIVDHLNLGRASITDREARDELAALNLWAGRKARAAAAYEAAFAYLRAGVDLLAEDSWERRYDLTLQLYTAAAEAASLTGRLTETARLVDVVLRHARTLLDRVDVHEVQILTDIRQSNPVRAVETALAVLEEFGVVFPEQPTEEDVGRALHAARAARGDTPIEELIELPEVTDPHVVATMRLLSSVGSAAYMGAPALFPLIMLRMVTLSIEHGNTPESTFAYANYGLILCGIVEDIESGYRFGNLAARLVDKLDAEAFKARTYHLLNCHIRHWKEHVRDAVKGELQTYHAGLESGDLEFAALGGATYIAYSYLSGRELTRLEQEMVSYAEAIRGLKQGPSEAYLELFHQAALNLLGRTGETVRLGGGDFDEAQRLALYQEWNDSTAFLMFYLHKLILGCFFQEAEYAVEQADNAEQHLAGGLSQISIPILHFYSSLARLALYPTLDETEREAILARVAASQEKMHRWAQHAPMNHLHKWHLVEAERARVLGDDAEAREHYDRAIALAQEHEYVNEEALAYELAAGFYQSRGQTRLASYYLRDAHYAYRRWGARAKVDDLEQRYPEALRSAESGEQSETLELTETTTATTAEAVSRALDLDAVLKASQALFAETELSALLENLLRITIANAGAQRGVLLLARDEGLTIEAEGTAHGSVQVLHSLPVPPDDVTAPSSGLPLSLVRYVARTHERVILDDAPESRRFGHDPYIAGERPASILCLPLLHQGTLRAVLYLENRTTVGAFTADRLELLTLLAAQAALALENALLHDEQARLGREPEGLGSDVRAAEEPDPGSEFPDPTAWLPQTKLRPPLLQEDVIRRSRLVEELHEKALTHRLTLLSATTGYGKTTLVSEWLHTVGEERARVAAPDVMWLGLDDHDNDAVYFAFALLTAVRTLFPDCGVEALTLLHSRTSAPGTAELTPHIQRFMGLLINDVVTYVDAPCVLILDDYHRITEPTVHAALAYLLERLPAQMHVVLNTRRDPPLPLARLRARGHLAELDTTDLAFTLEETAVFLNERQGLDLTADQIETLHGYTEGWPAGLRLLATSLEPLADADARAGLIAALPHGTDSLATHPHLLRYLAEEVLNRQEPALRTFLLQTSILSELTPELCTAVTGRADAAELLADLYRRNLFLTASTAEAAVGTGRDAGGRPSAGHTQLAFRYHDLFGDFLRYRLEVEMPEQIAVLHRRAAEAERVPARKIDHYLAAELWEPAADNVVQLGEHLLAQGRTDTLREWIEALPAAMLDARPQLCYFLGRCAWEQQDLEDAQRLLEAALDGFEAVEDTSGTARALVTLTACALFRSDLERIEALVERLPDTELDPADRVQTLMSATWVYYHRMDWKQAAATFGDAAALLQTHENTATVRRLCTYLSPALLVLPGALDTIETACRHAESLCPPADVAWQVAIDTQRTFTQWWRGRPDRALEAGQRALAARAEANAPRLPFHLDVLVAMAALHAGRQAYDQVHRFLELAVSEHERTPANTSLLLGILYLQARTYRQQGRVDDVRGIQEQMSALHRDTTASGGRALLLMARSLVARAEERHADAEHDLRRAIDLVSKERSTLLFGSPAVSLAQLYLARGHQQQALTTLQPVLAEYDAEDTPGRLLQEGTGIIPLLRLAVRRGVEAPFATRVLDQLGVTDVFHHVDVPDSDETLTPREMEVLELLATGATNRSIAEQLHIAIPTVKSHVTRILRKLDVSSRHEAVVRARDLEILPH